MRKVAIDPLVVKSRLVIILERIDRLKDIAILSEEQFLSNEIMQSVAERNLQIIAQVIINICTHLVAHNHWGSPKSYSDSVKLVSKHKVIETDLAERLIDLVKLRNVIVHLYLEIDPTIVYRSAKQAITDAGLFVAALKKLIE